MSEIIARYALGSYQIGQVLYFALLNSACSLGNFMHDNNATKTIFSNAINRRVDEIKRISLDILNHPESGYREYRTSKLVADWFRTNGFHVQTDVAKTGVIATFKTDSPGPHVVVMGELDALNRAYPYYWSPLACQPVPAIRAAFSKRCLFMEWSRRSCHRDR